jgi:SNF2 family DNA or RNA helicase
VIRIEVVGNLATAYGPFDISFINMLSSLRGRKDWSMDRKVKFTATPDNLALIRGHNMPIDWHVQEMDESLFRDIAAVVRHPETAFDYTPACELRSYQSETLDRMNGKKAFAVLWEMGLGKTALMIAEAGRLHSVGAISGLLVVAPNGVHRQWIDEQFPQHWDKKHKLETYVWKGRAISFREKSEALEVLSINIEALIGRGMDAALDFCDRHEGRIMLVVDESHRIKNHLAERTRRCKILGSKSLYRRILTGTPIAKNIVDAWSQFNFLDMGILLCPYLRVFRDRYCVMGGWQGKQVLGSKNVEQFYLSIAKHSSRLTKAEVLDLPEKQYVTVPYKMSDKTAALYQQAKRELLVRLEGGKVIEIATVATALLKLQQITGGFLMEGEQMFPIGNERIEVMMEMIEQISGPVLVWCRFVEDIKRVREALAAVYGDASTVTYFGETAASERPKAISDFLAGNVRFFVSNPQSGGVGLNLQGRCQDVIYYSNSFNSVDRWQSEDRTHRLGTVGAVTYYDIVAEKSIDGLILRNLKAKKDLLSLAVDVIRKSLEQE